MLHERPRARHAAGGSRCRRNGAAPILPSQRPSSSAIGSIRIDQLHFDSLAWMEFCISIELQSGQALTPEDIENMRYMFEIEEWLRAKL